MPKFLDMFSYDRKETENSHTSFINCVLLKDIGEQTKGSKFDTIIINMTFSMWIDNEDLEENIYL